MANHTSFILDAHLDAFVSAQVAAGRYRSVVDVIHAGLRLLEAREGKLATLSETLIEGEQSGVAGRLDLERIKRKAREAAGLVPS